jgi:hypothetical protein
MTFINHGCNGTYNMRPKWSRNEMNFQMETANQCSERSPDPYTERHYPMFQCHELRSNQNIEAGAELLDNYLRYVGGTGSDHWKESVEEIQHVCSGGKGFITEYEESDPST